MEGTQSQQEPETETEQQQWQNPVQSREGRRVVVVIETNVLFLQFLFLTFCAGFWSNHVQTLCPVLQYFLQAKMIMYE